MPAPRSVATFTARCRWRRHTFPYPLLPDMSYGEFIFSSQEGKSFVWLAAIDHPAWTRVAAMVQRLHLPEKKQGAAICQVLGHVADKAEGVSCYMAEGIICPVCGGRARIVDWQTRIGNMEIPPMTFTRFLQLTPAAQEQEVYQILRK